eukprot:TRINITY_DN15056_c0_g1_i1.p1 TRINITY_DN15056_c0_g1~~TRINITY_DN15056_c0_g1_i1.p1  ORF type:complete len:155 (-),score=25.51 TRINITY_DN15056_c0_g1_i1:175-639(-)
MNRDELNMGARTLQDPSAPRSHAACGGHVGAAVQRRGVTGMAALFESRLPCGLFPSQVSDLLDRDITPEDYELLLQLDEKIAAKVLSKAEFDKLTTVRKDFEGSTCSVCLVAFTHSDAVAALKCGHFFHRECVSKWLLERSRCCPLCSIDVAYL